MDRTNNRRRTLLICVLLSAVTLATYWPVVHYQFINFDDLGYIIQNPHVRAGFSWQNVSWAFTSGYGSNWHPLTWLSHMLDGQLFGLNAGGHHLVNLLFHTANAVLLFLVLQGLTGRTNGPLSPAQSEQHTVPTPRGLSPSAGEREEVLSNATWRSAFVAALFALHPLHVESVAWVAERKDVLSAFFFFLTIWAYVEYTKSNLLRHKHYGGREVSGLKSKVEAQQPDFQVSSFKSQVSSFVWYCLSLLLFALGLMSKPMLVTLPFVLLLLDYWPLGRWGESRVWSLKSKVEAQRSEVGRSMFASLLREKIPFFALSIASCVTTYLVQEHGGAVADLNIMPVSLRFSNAVVSYVGYMKKMVWPTDLALLYPLRGIIPDWMVGGSLLLLVVVSLLTLALLRRAPYLAVGWFWYLGTLVPVIGLVQVGMQSMADRYTYIPFIGLFIAITWGVGDAVKSKISSLKSKVGETGSGGQEAEGRRQKAEVRTDPSPQPSPLRNGRGRRLQPLVLGSISIIILGVCVRLTATQVRFWKDTETISVHSLAVTPDNPLMQNNLGSALLEQHRFEEAADHFRAALRLHPRYAEAESNLGFSLSLQGKLDEAIDHYHRALELKPNIVRTHYVLGQALSMQGKRDEAIAEFRITLELNPDWPPALNDLAWFRATDPRPEVRDGTEAVALAERACRLTEFRDPLMIGTLAAAYAEAGRFEDAVKTGEQARAVAAAAGKTALAERNWELVEIYRQKKAYHEPGGEE